MQSLIREELLTLKLRWYRQIGEKARVNGIEKAGHLAHLERPFAYNMHLKKILASFSEENGRHSQSMNWIILIEVINLVYINSNSFYRNSCSVKSWTTKTRMCLKVTICVSKNVLYISNYITMYLKQTWFCFVELHHHLNFHIYPCTILGILSLFLLVYNKQQQIPCLRNLTSSQAIVDSSPTGHV